LLKMSEASGYYWRWRRQARRERLDQQFQIVFIDKAMASSERCQRM
jgi:hypothetical protein